MKTQKLLSTFLLLFGILSLATAQSKIKGKGKEAVSKDLRPFSPANNIF
jgi:hypothetical protein